MDFISLLDGITFWHWLALGFGLLAVELLGTAGYFLWLGLSALLVGILLSLMPISWQLQWLSLPRSVLSPLGCGGDVNGKRRTR